MGNIQATIQGEKNGESEISLLSMQDYYPFGSPMPGRSIANTAAYQQGYQGQQLDPETGFNAFELRLYDSRLGSWLSPDPYRQHLSPYMAMSNNPFSFIDPDGGKDNGEGGGDPDENGGWMTINGKQVFVLLGEVNITAKKESYDLSTFPNPNEYRFYKDYKAAADNPQIYSDEQLKILNDRLARESYNVKRENYGMGFKGSGNTLSRNESIGLISGTVPLGAIESGVIYANRSAEIGMSGRILKGTVSVLGHSLNALSLTASGYDAAKNWGTDQASYYNARAIGNGIIVGLNAFNLLVPGLGTGLSIGVGFMDAYGVFDPIYHFNYNSLKPTGVNNYNPQYNKLLNPWESKF